MKSIMNLRYLFTLLLAVTMFGACEEFNDLDDSILEGGDADFSKFVAVGNSLTAGFQSNALYEDAQQYSFPALFARQVRIDDFEQPLISNPGIPGRLQLTNVATSEIGEASQQGQPLNNNLNRPFDNLGIPGAILADFLGQDIPGAPYAARSAPQANPFFQIVLRSNGTPFAATQAEQLAALNPTFVSFWLGNNDVLGYVTSSGERPYVPASAFTTLYQGSVASIRATGASMALFTIPNVTDIPFVFAGNTTLQQAGAITVGDNPFTPGVVDPVYLVPDVPAPGGGTADLPIYIERTNPAQPGVVVDTVIMSPTNPGTYAGDFVTLGAASSFGAALQSGQGLQRANPIPANLILDGLEVFQALTLVGQYNGVINSFGSDSDVAIVDVNAEFGRIFDNFIADMASGGTTVADDGIAGLQPTPGSLFSLDGVHPSNQGHAVVAFHMIEAINDAFGAGIPQIEPDRVPQGIPID